MSERACSRPGLFLSGLGWVFLAQMVLNAEC